MDVSSLTNYFRASLADEALLGMTINERDPGQLTASSWDIQDGRIGKKETELLFKAWKRRACISKNGQEPEEIEIWISPVTFSLQNTHGYRSRSVPRVLHPLWLTASLRPSGVLEPRDVRPWLSRDLLTPTASVVSMGALEEFDTYLSKNWDDSFLVAGWPTYFEFGREMLARLTALANDSAMLGEYEYVCKGSGVLAIGGANSNILGGLHHLYEQIVAAMGNERLALYSALLRGTPANARFELSLDEELEMAKLHLGQMSREHALGPSQRSAMHHFLNDGLGNVTTVNGPPGTGKTTLLKSVVATLLVQRAEVGAEAGPVIAATSANNQAVTNIIKDFGAIFPEKGSVLERRWLPEPLRSLGLYAASEINPDFHCITVRGGFQGFFQELETPGYLEQGTRFFLEKLHETYPAATNGPDKIDAAREARLFLRESIKGRAAELRKTINLFKDRRNDSLMQPRLRAELDAARENRRVASESVTKGEERQTAAKTLCGELAEVLTDLERHCARESVWLGIFGFIPAVREKRLAAIRADFQFRLDPDLLRGAKSPREVRDRLAARRAHAEDIAREMEATHAKARDRLAKAEEDARQRETLLTENENRVTGFLREHGLADVERNGAYAYLASLDTNLRYELFTLAVHYFEALWLEKAKAFVDARIPGEEWKNHYAPDRLRATWCRYAMLTPCIVSTVYMLPKFFRTGGANRQSLLGFLDLLIIDEAGQATTPTTACAFALARRAIVVGDRHQIEPVWKIPENVDQGNLVRHTDLARSEDQRIPESALPLCASRGSAMLMAQAASRHQLPGFHEPGLQLLEHRRCQPEIIEYCKKLVYPKLKVLTGKPKPDSLLPQLESLGVPRFGYLHVPGESERRGGSRCNPYEADNIAAWIKHNRPELEKIYAGKKIEEIVGVVTPFAAQAAAIQDALGTNLEDITVGTVHRLQGAERPIILFSLVYGPRDGGTGFIDAKVNLLNVAVSRAKHSFLLFGNMNVLTPGEATPSAKLATMLREKDSNEMTFPLVPRSDLARQNGVRHLSSLQAHRDMLREAFASAEREILLVSPFMTQRALDEDRVPDMVKEAVARGVAVEVYSDVTFHEQRQARAGLDACAAMLRRVGARVNLVQWFHNKTLVVDDSMLVEGSFNWLSASRSGDYVRQDHSICYVSPEVSKIKREMKETLDRCALGDKAPPHP